MSDRDAFRQSIEEYLRRGRKNWELFANTLGYRREHVSRILHGRAKMPEDFVHAAIRVLAELGCIRGRSQARRLLLLMDRPDFSPEDWNTKPLAVLDDNASRDSVIVEEASVSQQEGVRGAKQNASLLLWTVPYPRNPFFTGRDDLLHLLRERLTTKKAVALTQTQAISGLGGIGKTQTALEYAYRYRNTYSFVFWARATTREALISDFVAFAELLRLPEMSELDQYQISLAVKQWFATHSGWLLIFDNADDLLMVRDFLPAESKGHILLTTRAQAVSTLAQRVDVENMGMAEGTLFLLRRTKLLSEDAFLDQASEAHLAGAEALVIEMAFLPLALDQAGAYIEETGCGLSDYLHLYKIQRKVLLQRRGFLSTDHPEPVATTWSLSFQRVEEANPAAADLLRLCAFLDPDFIPEELISEGASYLGSTLRRVAPHPLRVNEAIEELRKFSLIQRYPDTKVLNIHRLVQAVLKDDMQRRVQRRWAERVVRAVNSIFVTTDATIWSQCRRYLPQAQVCTIHIKDYGLKSVEAERLLTKTAEYLRVHALYNEAGPLLQHALVICEQVLGASHSDTATSLNNLAALYDDQGKYEQAEPLYQRALVIYENVLGSDNPTTVANLNNLALLYYNQGKYEQAKPLFQRTLEVSERLLGTDHPDTAKRLNNLAALHRDRSEYEQAEPLYQRALAIRERMLGPDHPDTAISLSNLALLYRDQGKHEQAEPLLQRALTICEHVLGPSHPETATRLNSLALLYNDQEKHEQAELLYERALTICEQTLGPDHPNTATSLDNLAICYCKQGKHGQAESLHQHSLAIRERVLGPNHHSTAISLNNLALLYYNQEKYEQAEPLFQRALAICEQQLGPEHPDTAISINSLALLFYDQEKYEQAEPLFQRALAICEHTLGPDHPDTATRLYNLALFYRDQGKYEQAESLLQRALTIYKHAQDSV